MPASYAALASDEQAAFHAWNIRITKKPRRAWRGLNWLRGLDLNQRSRL